MSEYRHLSYRCPDSDWKTLQALAEYAREYEGIHGHSCSVECLEARLAKMFGHEGCAVMPSGKAAQCTALKLWSQTAQSPRIALHPRSHIEEWEGKAYSEVFGLQSVKLGAYDQQVSLSDLKALEHHTGVASVEIALRPLGGVVIDWSQLCEMSAYAREQGIYFHADAARIWEARAHYERGFDEIAALFDSLYVSLYKVIGGLFGGALLGPKTLISQARIWQQRLGQTPHRPFPYVLSAMKGLDENIPNLRGLHVRAKKLAAEISRLEGIVAVNPDPPHINMFQVWVRADAEMMERARDQIAEETGIWLFSKVFPAAVDGVVMFEVHVWQSATEIDVSEAVSAIADLLACVEDFRSTLRCRSEVPEKKSVGTIP